MGSTERKAAVRADLLERRADVARELAALPVGGDRPRGDDGDIALFAIEREDLEDRRERLRRAIRSFDLAIARLDAGGYGLCEDCGAGIAQERLDAIPGVSTCRTCQIDREKAAGDRIVRVRIVGDEEDE